ncbi:unnamed protein product [Gongylonema pulchrum]|uniref:Uncharacterized protein n=1 Tax=Gongylonema pulchrum TaxID=637853 RepID=A0A183EPP7_9BILA|nr:unnamed protein product [Gongylonema pulchrum]
MVADDVLEGRFSSGTCVTFSKSWETVMLAELAVLIVVSHSKPVVTKPEVKLDWTMPLDDGFFLVIGASVEKAVISVSYWTLDMSSLTSEVCVAWETVELRAAEKQKPKCSEIRRISQEVSKKEVAYFGWSRSK